MQVNQGTQEILFLIKKIPSNFRKKNENISKQHVLDLWKAHCKTPSEDFVVICEQVLASDTKQSSPSKNLNFCLFRRVGISNAEQPLANTFPAPLSALRAHLVKPDK